MTASIALALLIFLGSCHSQCVKPIVRREWNQLTTAEKTQYVAAAKASATSLTGKVGPGIMSLYDFVADHTQAAGVSHGNAQFYPFHRSMMYLWETTLTANGWTGGAVYWDWSVVSQNWWQADVFQYLGSTSRPDDNCVTDGQFSIGKYQVSPNPAFGSFARNYTSGDRNCLRRCGSQSALDTPEAIADAHFKATDYNSFRGNDFTGYHANGHLIIGGNCDMGNFFSSPNDPIFFLHHGFVDKTWWKWQMLCPEYVNDYEGAMVVSPADPSGVASLQQVLDAWGGYTVEQMLDTQNGDPLCYTYSQSPGDVTNFNPPNCPSGAPANTNWPFAKALSQPPTRTTSSSSSPTLSRNLKAESTWLSELVQRFVVIRGGANNTFGTAVETSLQVRNQRRDGTSSYHIDTNSHSPCSSLLFNNLSDDGWQTTVTYNSMTRTVCYNINDNCVVIPDGYSAIAIYKDLVSIKADHWNFGSPIDHDNPMPIRMLYPPSKLTCEPYHPTFKCISQDSSDCLGFPPMPSDEQLESHMINKMVHQCYLNKVWKWIDDCNQSQNCTSVATASLKCFIENGDWSILNL